MSAVVRGFQARVYFLVRSREGRLDIGHRGGLVDGTRTEVLREARIRGRGDRWAEADLKEGIVRDDYKIG